MFVCNTRRYEALYINLKKSRRKNPAYGRHRISRPMRIVGPIQFWRVCVICLEEEKNGAVDASTRPRVYAYTRPRVHMTDPRGAMDPLHPPPVFRAPHQFFHAKLGKNSKKQTFFYAAILDHFLTKMFNSETTSFQHFSPRIPNL